MLVFEFKTYGNKSQFSAVDEAIRTAQFVRNSCTKILTLSPCFEPIAVKVHYHLGN